MSVLERGTTLHNDLPNGTNSLIVFEGYYHNIIPEDRVIVWLYLNIDEDKLNV